MDQIKTKNKKTSRIKSLNSKITIKNIDKLDDKKIALLLGGEVDLKTGEIKKDNNWICNFH